MKKRNSIKSILMVVILAVVVSMYVRTDSFSAVSWAQCSLYPWIHSGRFDTKPHR